MFFYGYKTARKLVDIKASTDQQKCLKRKKEKLTKYFFSEKLWPCHKDLRTGIHF
jgi:hypothetical protein